MKKVEEEKNREKWWKGNPVNYLIHKQKAKESNGGETSIRGNTEPLAPKTLESPHLRKKRKKKRNLLTLLPLRKTKQKTEPTKPQHITHTHTHTLLSSLTPTTTTTSFHYEKTNSTLVNYSLPSKPHFLLFIYHPLPSRLKTFIPFLFLLSFLLSCAQRNIAFL